MESGEGREVREFDEASDGQRVQAVVGEQFRVKLKENPTTGFRWKLDADRAGLLRLLGEWFEPAGLQPGAGGVHTWEFQCAEQGEAALAFTSSRSWEAGAPARRFFLTAEIGRP
jgi:inhibitor of cysteine peptidase